MKYFSLSSFFAFVFLLLSTSLVAQLTITMDHPDGNYAVGETVHFLVHSTVSTSATYTINRGKYTDALSTGTVQLNAGATTDITIVGAEPENLHFSISTGWAGGIATAMVGANQMVPFEAEPADFDGFWNGVKGQLAGVPMNAQVVPYNSTNYSTSYTVSLGNIDGRKVYGMLTVPNGAGPFPVVLKMPPYGSFPISPEVQFAERTNAITLAVTIHNAPATQTDPNAYEPDDPTDRNLIYYKQAVAGGLRGLEYLISRPDFNGTDVVVTGVSQGAGLGTLIAGLDSRVKLLLIGTPTMGSHAGMLHDHPSGFPFYLNVPLQVGNQDEIDAVLEATKYYEAASAAKRYHGNVFLLTSYNDQVTIAETQFVISNFFDGKKVILHNVPGGHDNRPEEYLFGRFDYLRRYFESSNTPPFPWSGTDKGYMADAGTDKTATVGVPLSLTGTIEDNTTVNPGIPVSWRKVSGPGSVSFTSPNAYATQANFSQNGTYVLEFSGKDTGLLASQKLFYTMSDRVVVTVGGGSGNPVPSVVLSTPSTNVTGPFQVTATFSESVTGVSLSDFNVTNGNLSSLSGSGSTYTFMVSPVNVGVVTVMLPSNKAFDSANQGNTPSNMLSIQYSVIINQNIDLSLSLTADNTTVPLFSPVNLTLTITNSGAITAHNVESKFKLPPGFGLLSSFPSSGQYNSWTGVWSLDQLAPGATATVQVGANLITASPSAIYAQVTAAQENDVDSSPNNNAGPVPSEDDEAAVTVSSGTNTGTTPTVVLSTPSNVVSDAFVVKATFSQSVAGLSSGDFVVTNGSAGTFSGSGSAYTVTITPSSAGSVTVSLPINSATATTGGLGNTASNTLTVQYENTPSGEYCIPAGTPWNEWIQRVKIGSIDKYSSKEGYADFTDLSTDLSKDASHQITITYGHGYWIYDQNYSVWIDLNQDNDFDDTGEKVLDLNVPAVANGTNPEDVVSSIQIPSSALSGSTRMRVGLNRASKPTPCGKNGFGEYEDYTVNITGSGGGTNPGTYCASESTPWNDWIARVKINSIDNSSEKDGYGDYTNLVTDVANGQSTEISISLGHGYFIYDEYYRVWVDLNHDGDFEDANELVLSTMVASTGNATNPAPLVGTINIPDGAMLGNTRMRVSMRRDGYGTPCNQGGFGDVEDYTVNITEGGGSTGPTDYCASTGTPWNDWIERVQLGSINKSSGKESYADFTDISTDLMKGIPSEIRISIGHGYWIYDEYFDVWIDFNHDGDFDDQDENVFSHLFVSTGNNTNPAPILGSIVVPNNAQGGTTRMRVSMRRGNKALTPCLVTGFGETEDYTVNIQTPQSRLVYHNLLAFEAEESMGGVQANWVVDNATRTDYFVVQYFNEVDFVDLTEVDYSMGQNSFEYWDANAAAGMNYYRLKMVESDGQIHYSPIKGVMLSTQVVPEKVRLFPTASIGTFIINLSDFRDLAANINLVNASGQIIKSWKYDQVDQNLMSFDISGQKKGMYYVMIMVDGKRPFVEKVILID